jgi:c-di-GMP-binding flagellar brake protein YcgR
MWQGIDHRRFPRVKYHCTVRLHQADQDTSISAQTENLGLGGVCVLLEQGLDIFSPVDLEIDLNDGQSPLKAAGTIVWVVRRRDLRKGILFDTGIEFAQLGPEEKNRLEAVLQKKDDMGR